MISSTEAAPSAITAPASSSAASATARRAADNRLESSTSAIILSSRSNGNIAAPASTGVAIVLRDPDARAWAASVDRIADLSTPHGISLCLRLLGLVALIGDATWLAPYVTIRRDGAALDTALLAAAATTRLTAAGGLDENQMRALLLTRATKDTDPCSA